MELHIFKSFEDLDGARLMEIYREGNEENADELYPDIADRTAARERVEREFLNYLKTDFFSRGGREYWVLEDGGVWVCALRLYLVHSGLYYIEALETRPEYRRRGYAAELLNRMTDELKRGGAFRLCDCVSKRNIASLNTHFKCGFKIAAEEGFSYLTGETNDRTYGLELEFLG